MTTFATLDYIAMVARKNGVPLSAKQSPERLQYLYTAFWGFVEHLGGMAECGLFVVGPDGNVLRGSRMLTRYSDPAGLNGLFFAPRYGVLGAFVWERPRWKDVRNLYTFMNLMLGGRLLHDFKTNLAKRVLGQFFGMSVVFKVSDVERYFSSEEFEEPKPPQLKAEKELAEEIVRQFDAGCIRSRLHARELCGEGFSSRAFLRAWARAAEDRPALSRPGRRSADDI